MTASQRLKQVTLASDIIIQGHRIELGDMKLMVYTVMGAKDDLQVRAMDISLFLTKKIFNFNSKLSKVIF